ncbi:MAG TPA: WYL domain-containing protein [Candidatus Melainabacteria bacterium]|nr:WYL domain-containing protein [Candidatus Melainabacteria bacterium]HIN63785.1 WYL domain-containing protein [Candidatus Obscuribacterales bacterium]
MVDSLTKVHEPNVPQEGTSTLLSDLDFIAFDVETTGLSAIACKLVELSAVRFRLNGGEMEIFSELINPECEIPIEVTRIHGITDEMVKDSPTNKEVIPKFLEFVGRNPCVLVAHNAPFDVGFLKVAVARLGINVPELKVLDTLSLSRALVDGVVDYKLKTLAQHFEIVDGDYHRALADSHHVRHIFGKIMAANPDYTTLEHLQELNCLISLNEQESAVEPTGEVLFHVNVIKAAIDGKQQLKMIYLGNGAPPRYGRLITPIAVLENRGNHYLTAFCHQVDAERTFRIDRIKSLQVSS